MFDRKYRINPETLRYEEIRLPRKQRLLLVFFVSLFLLVTAVGLRVLYDQHAKSPRLVYYEKKNSELRQEYRQLWEQISQKEVALSEFSRKDDRLYRSIFGMDPIPSSIREAGTGGAVMYSSLQSISDPALVIDVFDKMDKVLMKAQIQSSSFNDLEEQAVYNQQLLAAKPLLQPISPRNRYWLTSTFGYRTDPFTRQRTLHQGIDMAGPYGLEIHAAGDGIVEIAAHGNNGYGKEVLIDHGFGYSSRYAHLQEILVKPGDTVRRGQLIGKLGSSGRSTGPHLHYEVRYNNRPLNPMHHFFENITPEEYEMIASRASSE
jgi:murein DD-endopeptidase MepM/ murein hydrolase activator NlpD